MQRLDTSANRHALTGFGSSGAVLGVLARARDAQVSTLLLVPGGVVGAHPAATRQLLLVVAGWARVTGGDGEQADLGAGHAVLVDVGELHETRAPDGATLVVVEGDF